MKIIFFLAIYVFLIILQGCDDNDGVVPIADKPRLLSYKSVSQNMELAVYYEYNPENNISKIAWERSTPNITTGSDVFTYQAGKLKEQIRSITGLVDEKTIYTWDGDVIFASSTYRGTRKIGFAFYDYNQNDQLEAVEFYKQEGEVGFLRTDSIGLSYHPDGNLFKMFKYSYDYNEQRLILLSTQTFPEYMPSPNPVATVELLPILNLQQNLPKTYVISDGPSSLSYSLEYDLRADGYPRERTVAFGDKSEKTVYTYDK